MKGKFQKPDRLSADLKIGRIRISLDIIVGILLVFTSLNPNAKGYIALSWVLIDNTLAGIERWFWKNN